jgi:hypothetical protein
MESAIGAFYRHFRGGAMTAFELQWVFAGRRAIAPMSTVEACR